MRRPPASIDVQFVDGAVPLRSFDGFPQPAGAECIFLGRTRQETHPDHGKLVRLSYEAHVPLAERILRGLADRAVERFGCLAVRIHHAVGNVPPGEPSVIVQVVCGHRDEAFRACRFLIDELKSSVPIWKREVWDGGATWSPGTAVTPVGKDAS